MYNVWIKLGALALIQFDTWEQSCWRQSLDEILLKDTGYAKNQDHSMYTDLKKCFKDSQRKAVTETKFDR
jgi:hypothetical protein